MGQFGTHRSPAFGTAPSEQSQRAPFQVLRRLSEQQQHLMQPMPSVTTTPNGTAPVQQQLPTQLLQQLQQQLQQYESFQTEVMRRLSEVGADSPPLDVVLSFLFFWWGYQRQRCPNRDFVMTSSGSHGLPNAPLTKWTVRTYTV